MNSKEQILIKKYSNRKLYDTSKSCYVTLEELGDDIINDVDILVIDNKTKEDITSQTVAKYIFEKILKGIESQEDYISINTLKDFLKKLNNSDLESALKSN